MHERISSEILAVLIMVSLVSAVTVASNSFIVRAEPVTLEEILAAIDALEERLEDVEAATTSLNSTSSSLVTKVDNLQSQLNSISATTATTVDVAILDSTLDALSDAIDNLESSLSSLNATVASKIDGMHVAALGASVDELSTALDQVKASLSSLSNEAATSNDIARIDATTVDLSGDIEILNRLIIVALVLALIAAVASTVAVYYILKHSDKTLPNRGKT
jgi:chromosome segregation ATPase